MSLNPCCDGNNVEQLAKQTLHVSWKLSFNPCCNGNDVEQLTNTMF